MDGEISASAVRVVFVGDTGVLRNFLNAIAEHDSRLLVRGVEAEALSEDASGMISAEHQNYPQTTAIVRRSKFTVVVEAFEFLRSLLPEASSS